MGLRGGGVLVGEDGAPALGGAYCCGVWEDVVVRVDNASARIDGWHDRQVVLEFEEAGWCDGDGFVEGVKERGVVWAKG